jgi:hypothetical protein
VHAKTVLFGGEQRIHIPSLRVAQWQIEPAHAVHQHVQTRTHIARYQVHRPHIAAMRIQKYELANASLGNRFRNVGPQIDYGVPFWAKPPMSTWLSALSIKIFGVNEFAVRFPALVISLILLYLLSFVWRVCVLQE